MDNKKIKEAVRKGYATYAKNESTCCGPIEVCCGNSKDPKEISKTIGYSKEQMKSVPEESNLGLGCGNPTAIASLKKGEVVLDLGSGAGFDCFLAANKVGENGKVIGVDMTPEMIKKAEHNAKVWSEVKVLEDKVKELKSTLFAAELPKQASLNDCNRLAREANVKPVRVDPKRVTAEKG